VSLATAPPSSYTIDQLAAATGVPSRTIRLYQTKGLLPRPPRQGRICLYGSGHVDRLRLIGELQDRGLQLSAIRDLVSHGDGEGDVTVREWLGLGDRLRQPWSEDTPQVLTSDEVTGRLRSRSPGTLAELLRTGVLVGQGNGAGTMYLVPSPGLLDASLALDDAGVDLATSAAAAAILRRRLAQAVAEVVQLLLDRAGNGFGHEPTPEALAAAFEGLRVTGGEATRLIFASEVERVVGQVVQSGTLTAAISRARSA
jgi:DNA-binding transcriptional MerR regulator